jgi:hypothetical protein
MSASEFKTLRSDLIDRDHIRELAEHRPRLLPEPECESPWWQGEAPVMAGARVLIAVEGPQQCSICPMRHAVPAFHWTRVLSVAGSRAVVVTLTGGPLGHDVMPGQLVEVEPARHVHMVLATDAALTAFEAWADDKRGNWAGLLYVENPDESNWAA